MMHTKGKFKVLETESYIAVALPLDPAYIKVRFSSHFYQFFSRFSCILEWRFHCYFTQRKQTFVKN